MSEVRFRSISDRLKYLLTIGDTLGRDIIIPVDSLLVNKLLDCLNKNLPEWFPLPSIFTNAKGGLSIFWYISESATVSFDLYTENLFSNGFNEVLVVFLDESSRGKEYNYTVNLYSKEDWFRIGETIKS